MEDTNKYLILTENDIIYKFSLGGIKCGFGIFGELVFVCALLLI